MNFIEALQHLKNNGGCIYNPEVGVILRVRKDSPNCFVLMSPHEEYDENDELECMGWSEHDDNSGLSISDILSNKWQKYNVPKEENHWWEAYNWAEIEDPNKVWL